MVRTAAIGALAGCLAGCLAASLAGCAAATPEPSHGSPVSAPARAATRATSGLDPELQRRFDAAQAAAAAHGLSLTITSGRRTVEEQEELIAEAIAEHGSVTEAHKYVLPPQRSAHVAGTAVDVGDWKAAAWLAEHQVDLGLCRTYANEWWHFELVGAVGEPCPPMHPDSSSGWAGIAGG
jgi:D-alanyl-D-alanine dipeptidase